MEKTVGIRQYLTLLLLFGITLLLLGFTVDVTVTDEAGVRTELPATLGSEWTGFDVLFCHSLICGRSWLVRDLEPDDEGRFRCLHDWNGHPCGNLLHPMSYGEFIALPRDTIIFKKQYFHNERPEDTVFAAVVLSGNDRSSIHRPEVCMTGQGHRIEGRQIIEVTLPGRGPLQVMVLNLSRPLPNGQTMKSYYAYWFVGKDVETPHHLERMLWMGRDRIFRNVAHRWAYIAITGPRSPGDSRYLEQIQDVISLLYPQISLIDLES